MASKTKITLLIPAPLAMLLLILPKVAMTARNFEEGEAVKETNEAGDARLVDGLTIPDIVRSIPDIVGSIPDIVRSLPDIVGSIPSIFGNLPAPGIDGGPFPRGFDRNPGIVGGNFPRGGGLIPSIGGAIPGYGGFSGGGYPGQGGYIGRRYCAYGCCVWALGGGYCANCCTI